MPGHYLKVRNKQVAVASYYEYLFIAIRRKSYPMTKQKQPLKELWRHLFSEG